MTPKQRLFEVFEKIDPTFKTTIPNTLLKRIPFLKDYNIFINESNRLQAQRVVYNPNVKIYMGDKVYNFEQYNVSSELFYYTQHIHDNIFHNFILKNKFHLTKPDEMDELLFRVFLAALKIQEEKLSYRKEIIVKEDERLNEVTMSTIINDINKKMFEIEEFTSKHKINLFENENK